MRFWTARKVTSASPKLNHAEEALPASERWIMTGSSARRRLGTMSGGALATVIVVCVVSKAPGQDQSTATPNATIYARKSVMDTISDKMDRIEAAVSSNKKIDYDAVREDADVISVLLQAFPHMFPLSTNQWKPNATAIPRMTLTRRQRSGPITLISTSRRPPRRSTLSPPAAQRKKVTSRLRSHNFVQPAIHVTRSI